MFECKRLQKVEAETRGLHYYLEDTDNCYFIGEYTSRRDFSYGQFNQLIANLKKPPTKEDANPKEYEWKKRAIKLVAQCFRSLLQDDALNQTLTLVPIPPSKTGAHPEYDDRMHQICTRMVEGLPNADVQSLIETIEDREATHHQDHKPPPDELRQNYQLTVPNDYQPREHILLVDDMLTTGSHFKACQQVLVNAFPDSQVYGLFVTRRVFPPDDEMFAELLG